MDKCTQACPYNTLDGCKVEEYRGVCPLANTVNPITERKMTNANRVRSMNDDELNERGAYTDITSLVADVNVNEIADHIRNGNLASWVKSWQQQMAFELENLKLSEKD